MGLTWALFTFVTVVYIVDLVGLLTGDQGLSLTLLPFWVTHTSYCVAYFNHYIREGA